MEISSKARIFAALMLVPMLALAQSLGVGAGGPTQPIPYKPGKVIRLTITAPSQKSDLDIQEDCSGFVMKPAWVREFFRNAKPVSEQARMHELDWSACYAEGRVEFANKDAGTWLIARHGVGALTLSKGKFKGKTIYFHCLPCEDWED